MVSIQLLLLFYWMWHRNCNGTLRSFNTTFVTVLCIRRIIQTQSIIGFNTTFVTVLSGLTLLCSVSLFRFNTTFVTVLLVVVSSALLKAAFQYNFCYCSIGESIWNYPAVIPFQYNFCYCSIIATMANTDIEEVFQYNFCYCSIVNELPLKNLLFRFNTTFVTVLL